MACNLCGPRLHIRRRDMAGQQHAALIDGCRDPVLQPGSGANKTTLDIGLELEIADRPTDATFLPGGVTAAAGGGQPADDQHPGTAPEHCRQCQKTEDA